MSDTPGQEQPLAQAGPQPSVTFALLCFNQERFIREAVLAALAQDFSPLEILISDDHSSDTTFAIVQSIVAGYRGPHTIRLNRNERNLGLVDHVNLVFEMARGELIVVAAGDDVSAPARTRILATLFAAERPMLIHSSVERIDENGASLGLRTPPVVARHQDLAAMVGMSGLFIGASGAWNRSLYTRFGPIRFRGAYEDLVFGFRAALDGSLTYIDQPLVKYRVGVGMSTRPVDPRQRAGKLIAARCRGIDVRIDVQSQRLADLTHVEPVEGLKRTIGRHLVFEQLRHDLYRSPSLFVRRLFSADALHALKALSGEALFLSVSVARFVWASCRPRLSRSAP